MNLSFAPSVPQAKFLKANTKYVAYGGARGGGKSWVLRAKLIMLCLTHPGIKCIIIRRTYKELFNNHVVPLSEMLHGIATYNKSEKLFTFANGSTIALGYCDNDNAATMQYQGAEYHIVAIDEATNLEEEWIRKISACCRGVDDYPKRIYITCNPGGPSHGYIKRLFVDKLYEETEKPEDYTFIQARVHDNSVLMDTNPDYVHQLEALPPKLRSAWLDGSWDVYSGQFFEEWANRPEHYKDRRWTHVIDPLRPSEIRGWPVYRSFDWGFNRCFSTGYWTVDRDGVVYRIADFYGVQRDRNGQAIPNEGLKWPPDKVFAEMAKMEREHPLLAGKQIHGVADPAIWDAQTGISIAETAGKYGIFFSKGDNRRIPGWMQMHYRLAFDTNGYPQMYITTDCKDAIRTIPLMQYDEHNPEDLSTDLEDHICDEIRYFCQSRPIRPIEEVGEYRPEWGADPLNQFN